MNIISQIFLTIFLLNIFVILFASVLWKNRSCNFAKFVLAGSYIYRDLPTYIKRNRVRAFLLLSYSAIITFMLFVLSASFHKF